jgi:hypothetical protein
MHETLLLASEREARGEPKLGNISPPSMIDSARSLVDVIMNNMVNFQILLMFKKKGFRKHFFSPRESLLLK